MIQVGSVVTLLGALGFVYPGTFHVLSITADGTLILDIPGYVDGAYVEQKFVHLVS